MRLGQCHSDALFSWSQRHSAIDLHRCHMVAQRFSSQLTTSINRQPPEKVPTDILIDCLCSRILPCKLLSCIDSFTSHARVYHIASTCQVQLSIARRRLPLEWLPPSIVHRARRGSHTMHHEAPSMMTTIRSDQYVRREKRSTKGGVPWILPRNQCLGKVSFPPRGLSWFCLCLRGLRRTSGNSGPGDANICQ